MFTYFTIRLILEKMGKLSREKLYYNNIWSKNRSRRNNMPALPKQVSQEWENREGPIILATVDGKGVPNAIYATCVSKYDEETLVVADNYFSKTRENINSDSYGSLLFITKDGKSYQIKGEVQYHTEGEIYDDMKRWNPTKHPGHAAAVIKVTQVYSGSKQLA